MNLVSYIRQFLVPMKDYIFLSFIILHVVPYTLYSSINICCLIENKSTKETKPILLDQRKQTFSLQPWHRWVLFGPHRFLYFNQLVIFKNQEISHKNPDFWLLFKKLKDLATYGRDLYGHMLSCSSQSPVHPAVLPTWKNPPTSLWQRLCWSPKFKSNHTPFFLNNKQQVSAGIMVTQNKENFSSSYSQGWPYN